MHTGDTNYTIIKNGVVVVSGTGAAIRVDGNRLVIRDGPQETQPLCLTRAEASRKPLHIVVCGHAGGFVTFDALRWLRDTGVAFSQLDWKGTVVIASGPRGPDQPDLRRAQALVCSGVMPKAADAIACEILRVKLCGQAEVAGLLGFEQPSVAICSLAEGIARETDGRRALSVEAEAAWIYWNLWERMPVRFARRNPQRLGPNGRWRPGRPDPWLTFGSRTSLLSGKPSRATTPGNALLNYLYAVLESEMTVALLAHGLDPGIGMFHADLDNRSSLALDAIEAVRPCVEYWLIAYIQASVFANRDFHEIPDGEVRLSHPLNSHLAHTAALWRRACEPIAEWLARSFDRASSFASVRAGLVPGVVPPLCGAPESQPLTFVTPIPMPPLRTFISTPRGHRPPVVKDNPVPRACWECGQALSLGRRAFCGDQCAANYRQAMGKLRPVVEPVVCASRTQHRGAKPGRRAAERLPASDGDSLRRWYTEELQPRLARMQPTEVALGAAVGRSYAYYIVAGTRIPHPRHYPSLAALVGVELPGKLLLRCLAAKDLGRANFSRLAAGHENLPQLVPRARKASTTGNKRHPRLM
jgi:CRISPR/Cas system-associated endonuclease Cas1